MPKVTNVSASVSIESLISMLATLDAEPHTFAAGISAFCPIPLTQKV